MLDFEAAVQAVSLADVQALVTEMRFEDEERMTVCIGVAAPTMPNSLKQQQQQPPPPPPSA